MGVFDGDVEGGCVGDLEGLAVGLFVDTTGLPVGAIEGLAVSLVVGGLVAVTWLDDEYSK